MDLHQRIQEALSYDFADFIATVNEILTTDFAEEFERRMVKATGKETAATAADMLTDLVTSNW